ncbi:hypothetical protein Poly30_06640 [Planctomycetes bacterium Poly30]|uniref:Lipoprotein n=1 Tax=Saltatorellus ferox TaxID=2528018 RepID=A0A518EM57_9BACT|nr:hypothetical protein Poly30_06640 [Planctomycetes bacterium Poly30]
MTGTSRPGQRSWIPAILFLLTSLMAACGKTPTEGRTEQARVSREVAAALTAHVRKHGASPAHLDALVPEFLSRLPQGIEDEEAHFHYESRPEAGWRLTFWFDKKMYSRDSDVEGLWISGDYDEDYDRSDWRPLGP